MCAPAVSRSTRLNVHINCHLGVVIDLSPARGGVGARCGRDVGAGLRGDADAGQLPASEAAVPSLPGERRSRSDARECRARTTDVKTRRRVLALVKKKYSGDPATRFGPTLAAEHLDSEDGITVDHETLRRWMLAAGLWSRARKRSPHRQRRERMAHFGELLQLDGSFHSWFEDRGPQRCLLTLVDDATGRTFGQLGEQETIWAAAGVLRAWIEQWGIPRALYTDWKNVYVRRPTAAEEETGAEPLTQFGRMCAARGIKIIPASSPQAKGRIERNHGRTRIVW